MALTICRHGLSSPKPMTSCGPPPLRGPRASQHGSITACRRPFFALVRDRILQAHPHRRLKCGHFAAFQEQPENSLNRYYKRRPSRSRQFLAGRRDYAKSVQILNGIDRPLSRCSIPLPAHVQSADETCHESATVVTRMALARRAILPIEPIGSIASVATCRIGRDWSSVWTTLSSPAPSSLSVSHPIRAP